MLLQDYRKRIDEVDDELLRLLNKRAQMCAEIGRMKGEAGLPLYDERREMSILQRMHVRNTGPISPVYVDEIFEAVLTGCIEVEAGSHGLAKAGSTQKEKPSNEGGSAAAQCL